MLNSTCDDSVNTNTGLKCTSIDLLQLRTLWNNVINTTEGTEKSECSYYSLTHLAIEIDTQVTHHVVTMEKVAE